VKFLDECKAHLEKSFFFGGLVLIGSQIIAMQYSGMPMFVPLSGFCAMLAGLFLLGWHWISYLVRCFKDGPFLLFFFGPAIVATQAMAMMSFHVASWFS
jgi:hypothetical protein